MLLLRPILQCELPEIQNYVAWFTYIKTKQSHYVGATCKLWDYYVSLKRWISKYNFKIVLLLLNIPNTTLNSIFALNYELIHNFDV